MYPTYTPLGDHSITHVAFMNITIDNSYSVLFLGTSNGKWDGKLVKHNNTWTLEPLYRRGGGESLEVVRPSPRVILITAYIIVVILLGNRRGPGRSGYYNAV